MVRVRHRRHWLLWTAAATGVLALLIVIDDPTRDFTTNHARIAEDSEDSSLRPLVVERSPAELVEATRRAARRIKNWEYVGTARFDGATTVVFERTGRILRSKDDIMIRVTDFGDRCRLTGESRSRRPYGDLGQNPRNLRRILAEIERQLETDAPPVRPASHESDR